MMLLLSLAWAGELNFSPDRPGVGDSTGVVGSGAVMVEGGVVASVDNPAAVGTSGIVGRFGVADPLELRVRVPDVTLIDGEASAGSIGIGGKVGGNLTDDLSISWVPELFIETDGGDVGGALNTNVAYAIDDVGLWLHASTVVNPAETTGFLGGGVAYAFNPLGVYVNGGHGFNGDPMFGGGGWLALTEAFQLDAGCDVVVSNGQAFPLVLFGMSGGF